MRQKLTYNTMIIGKMLGFDNLYDMTQWYNTSYRERKKN